ncbi:cysteine--tRNA ligase [Patescibacteria group bacterium]|nr:cysteine--tRNA ligase [Patescibacteria group bacterium]
MLKVFNTLSRKKEVLKIQKGEKLNLFVCGPTVYDLSHIGHARTYIAFDVIVKYLRQVGLDVYYLQNITDIDDKIIQRALETEKDPKDLARQFEKEYFQDMESLGIDSVTTYAKATDYIKEIINQVERLLGKGYAYKLEGDGIYYDIVKFTEYGKLSHRTVEQAEDAVSRIDESVKKKNKGDFALWKFSEPGEPKWDSPWGWGRPGWHIEDTAITEKYFGSQYDIHGGARDLIFPHHEAEISQMEAISGKKPLAKYWMHTGFLTVSGEKMAKSQGNFITIRDFLVHNSPRLLRLLVTKTHYRSPIDYSEKILEQTKNELERIDEFVDILQQKSEGTSKLTVSKFQKAAEKAMEDDFNTPVMLATLFEFIRETNVKKAYTKAAVKFLEEIDIFLGFIFWDKAEKKIPVEIVKLVKEREEYRKQEDWQKADELRKTSEDKGWKISDTSDGPRIKKLD